MTDYATMEAGPEIDTTVIDRIFGWKAMCPGLYWRDAAKRTAMVLGSACHRTRQARGIEDYVGDGLVFSPSTDPAADYEVLCHVRQKWEPLRVCDVRDALQFMWSRRKPPTSGPDVVGGATQYRPGDYARAALIVLDKEQPNAD